MLIDFSDTSLETKYRLLTSAVVPRPIAWVSTKDKNGRDNLAPFSFFNVVSTDPPILVFAPGPKMIKQDGQNQLIKKDTLRNIEETGEFVVNIVSYALAQKMNQTAAEYPSDVSEFEAASLTAVPSSMVQPLRVKESPINLECKLHQLIDFGQNSGTGKLILGQILCIHIDDSVLVNGRIEPTKLDAVGRLGANFYTSTRDLFSIVRPSIAE